MPADPSCSYDEYARRVKRIVAHARDRSVAVEAELGELPCGTSRQNRDFSRKVQRPTGAGSHSGAAAPIWPAVLPPCGASGSIESEGQFTDPHDAERFVRETGVDLLAVSVGNVHIQMTGESELDLERLAAIRARVPVPLVLHGGTGITRRSLQAAIGLGVAKVNYGTYLKQHYLRVLRERLVAGDPSANPHELLGMGGPSDLLVAGRIAVRDAVLERITTLGCCGRV